MKKMYVWNPDSLSDYFQGMICAIADSKKAAIDLAVAARLPYMKKHPLHNPAKLKAINASIDVERETFREELRREKPTVIARGAVYVLGGG